MARVDPAKKKAVDTDAVFQDRLARVAQDTEALLDRLLASAPIDGERARPARLLDVMRYASLGGGKRLRPFLVVEAAALFDVPRQNSLMAGAALECVHCYSLAHDDLPAMDNDVLLAELGRRSIEPSFGREVEHLPAHHPAEAGSARERRDELEPDVGVGMRLATRKNVEGEGEKAVACQDGARLVECLVRGRAAASLPVALPTVAGSPSTSSRSSAI